MPDGGLIYPVLTGVDTITERFTLLTESYRLLVGAAEELTRTPSATEDIIQDSIIRTAYLGNILDQLLILLQIAIIIEVAGIDSTDGIPNPYL
ncbi:MAG TPA: hypothetical protein VKY40_08850 [Halanaerobiales bacterium]|nr:hypothetical protein [Halanaerobiales bacterium]